VVFVILVYDIYTMTSKTLTSLLHTFSLLIHDIMPYDPIQGQGQGHGGPKVAKMARFKGYLLRRYACNQITDGLIIMILQENI